MQALQRVTRIADGFAAHCYDVPTDRSERERMIHDFENEIGDMQKVIDEVCAYCAYWFINLDEQMSKCRVCRQREASFKSCAHFTSRPPSMRLPPLFLMCKVFSLCVLNLVFLC